MFRGLGSVGLEHQRSGKMIWKLALYRAYNDVHFEFMCRLLVRNE